MARIRISVLVVLFMILTTPLLAAEGGGQGWGMLDTIGKLFNLAVLFGILFYALRKPLPKMFAKRREDIRQALEEARRAREEAQAKLHAIEDKMSRLEGELAAIRKDAQQEAEAEGQRILDLSRQESEKIIGTARREIDGLTQNAEKELRRHAATLSVELAESMLRREVRDSDQQKMFDRFVGKLEEIR